MFRTRVCFAVVAGDIGDEIEIDLTERAHSRTFDQVIGMLVMLGFGDENADVVQRGRGAIKCPRTFPVADANRAIGRTYSEQVG